MAWEVENNNNVQNPQWEVENSQPMTQSVMDAENKQMYNVPIGMDGRDAQFAIDTQHKGADKASFFGKVWASVTDKAKSFGRGVVSFPQQVADTAIAEGLDLETERKKAAGKAYNQFAFANNPMVGWSSADWVMPDDDEIEIAKATVDNIQALRDRNNKFWERKKEAILPEADMSDADRVFEGVGNGIASIAGLLGMTAATKNPEVSAVVFADLFGKMRKNEYVDKALESGMDVDDVYALGMGAGAIEGGIELVGGHMVQKIAKIKPIQELGKNVITAASVKLAKSKVGQIALNKIGTRHANSTIKAFTQGFASEGLEEASQQGLGMVYENATDVSDYDFDEIMSETLFSGFVGGIAGGLPAAGGTHIYNKRVKAVNEQIKSVLQEQTPELTTKELQVTADAIQEVLYQSTPMYENELNELLKKEVDTDVMPEGLTPESLTAETRRLLKEKYEMTDEDIDRTIKSTLGLIDARNQFNEAYTTFRDGLEMAGRNTALADGEARILAARALAVARAEGVNTNEVLKRWNLQFIEQNFNDFDNGVQPVNKYAESQKHVDNIMGLVPENYTTAQKRAIRRGLEERARYGDLNAAKFDAQTAKQWFESKDANDVIRSLNKRVAAITGVLNGKENLVKVRKSKKINPNNINPFEALVDDKLYNRLAKADKANKGDSLLTFIVKRGGLKDVGGELKSRDAQKQRIGLINNKSGNSFDDMALFAWEHGYFPNKTERPSINDLLDAIDDELFGKKHYQYQEGDNFSMLEYVNSLAEQMDMLDIDYSKMTAAEAEAAYRNAVDEYTQMMTEEDDGGQWNYQEAAELKCNIDKIDADRLAFERKDINPELIGRENEEVKAVKIDRFFANQRESKNISIDDVLTALDKTVEKNANGVRVLKNSVTGETATLSNRAINEMFSSTSARDGANIGGILGKECIANIAKIFDNALMVKETADIRHGTKSKIKRYANAVQSDGGNFIVKITVKEMANNRHQLTDIEIEENGGRDLAAYDLRVGKKNTAGGNISTNKSVALSNGNAIIINDLIEFVNSYTAEYIKIDGKDRATKNSDGIRIAKTEAGLRAFYKWFGDSKVVDAKGRPLVVYHGTSAKFDTFDIKKAHDKQYKKGFFFTADKAAARMYGNIIMPVYLKAETDFYKSKKTGKPIDYIHPKNDSRNIWIVFDNKQIKSVDNIGTFSENTGNIYYQFAGKNALTADMSSLTQAQNMEKVGYDAELIRGQTGWFKGIDGKWRFEISDKDAKVNHNVLEDISSLDNLRAKRQQLLSDVEAFKKERETNAEAYLDGYLDDLIDKRYNEIEKIDYDIDHGYVSNPQTTLGELLKHDNLYAAYPELKYITVKMQTSKDLSSGGYSRSENAIYVDSRLTDDEIKSTLMHEIQHVIQNKENFSRGGNMELANAYRKIIKAKEVKDFHKALDRKIAEAMAEQLRVYNISQVDAEKIAGAYGKYYSSIFDDSLSNEEIIKAEKEYYQLLDSLGMDSERVEDAYKAIQGRDLWNEAVEETKSKLSDANTYEIYKAFAGEVEARNTQARMEMSDEERAATAPESTQDIKNADALVVFPDGTEAAYYQSAFAGSRVDYDRPSLEAIGSGEGNQAHGWGLYYALNRYIAEKYRKAFTEEDALNDLVAKHEGLLRSDARDVVNMGKDSVLSFYKEELANYENQNITYGDSNAEIVEKHILGYRERIRAIETITDDEIAAIKNNKGQVHEVDIPENPYLLDEQEDIGEQSDIVRRGIRNTLQRLKGLAESGAYPEYAKALQALDYEYADIANKLDTPEFYENKTGYQIYDIIEQIMGSAKEASQFLEENGIKGITYDGRSDERCFVIFNPADVKVIQKFYQETSRENPRGAYKNGIIYLFENNDASTVIHELGHFFLDDMRKFADNETTQKQLEAIYKYLGSEDGNLTTEQHEYFANSFEVYLLEGRAPNQLLGKVFARFKKWLRNLWIEVKRLKDVKLTDDVRKTFDEMLGGKGIDFAMQMSGFKMAEAAESGNIPYETVSYALDLLKNGKMSRAEMDDILERLKTGELARKDVYKELKQIEDKGVKHNEALNPFDTVKYREALLRGNINKRNVMEKIERLMKWTEPREQNGRTVGRFGDKRTNDFFEAVRADMALDKDEAKKAIAANKGIITAILQSKEMPEIERNKILGMPYNENDRAGLMNLLALENRILSIPAKTIDLKSAIKLYDDLSDSYNIGRLTANVTGELKKARRNKMLQEVKDVLTDNGRIDWHQESGEVKKFIRRIGQSQYSWGGLMDLLSMNDKSSKTNQSNLSKIMDVFEQEQAEARGIADDGEKISRYLADALKSSGNAVIAASKYINDEIHKKVTVEWNRGRKTFTKDQLLDIYMKAQDPETRKIMLDDPINAYNEDFLQAVGMELNAQDKAVASALFKFYNDNYAKINDFYEEKYGVSMPHNPFYSPRSMVRTGINVEDGSMAFAAAGFTKNRTAKAGAVDIKGAFATWNKYVAQTNHWLNWSDKLVDINSIFGDAEVKKIIESQFGAVTNSRIKTEITNMAGSKVPDGWGKTFDKVRSNFAKSVLSVKPSLMIKQLTSFPAYLEHMSVADFSLGIADFIVHPKEAINTLGNTTLMKTRNVDIIRDFAELSKLDVLKGKKGIKLSDLMMLNIKLGDRGAIYAGGWALYKAELKKNLKAGMSEAEAKAKALDTFERVTDETQQSGRISQQSYWQSNPFLRAFTMFMSSQNQYLRKEINAVRGMATGRMSVKQGLKTLFIFHVLLPCLFQYAADGFDWDKDAQLKAATLGSLNGFFIVANVLSNIWDAAAGQARSKHMMIKDVLQGYGSIEDLTNAFMKLADEDYEFEDVYSVLKEFGKPVGELAGVPVKYALDLFENAGDYAENDEYFKEVLLWLGWSPYALRDRED